MARIRQLLQEARMTKQHTVFAGRSGRLGWLVPAGLAAALAGLPAFGQSMKPGLWETTTLMGGNPDMDKAMAQMQQQMANMPAAQRKQMEDMMARQGVSPPGSSARGMSSKVCITREMAERKDVPAQQEGKCTRTTTSQSAGSMKMTFVCTDPASSGEGEFTLLGDSAYTMKLTTTSATKSGPRNMTLNTWAKWLASDCGNIKPIASPPRQ
jgi:Protein of unknown function (DUF3617)